MISETDAGRVCRGDNQAFDSRNLWTLNEVLVEFELTLCTRFAVIEPMSVIGIVFIIAKTKSERDA